MSTTSDNTYTGGLTYSTSAGLAFNFPLSDMAAINQQSLDFTSNIINANNNLIANSIASGSTQISNAVGTLTSLSDKAQSLFDANASIINQGMAGAQSIYSEGMSGLQALYGWGAMNLNNQYSNFNSMYQGLASNLPNQMQAIANYTANANTLIADTGTNLINTLNDTLNSVISYSGQALVNASNNISNSSGGGSGVTFTPLGPVGTIGGGGGCYITTAVCKYLGKSDTCEELTLLRKFRDNYMMETEQRKILVRDYYEVAPTIVEKIDNLKEKDDIYLFLLNNFIKKAVKEIKRGCDDAALEYYINMVNFCKIITHDKRKEN